MRNPMLAAIVAAAALAAPALADEPGPGGARPPVARTGEEVYRIYCQACHMADAKGAVGVGAFPALAGNPKLSSVAFSVYIIERGKGAMPWFRENLTPEQEAAVIGYLRTHFGNNYPEPVTPADVSAVRATVRR